ncbi:PIN domain-containing protein [Synoicihabitans lomoniglobus]|uniref:PIN domain-containing protein n=1 Tax=Synoicihabitans lomoniglobus TaxID=2909285 RepID=UPI003CE48D66
MNRLENLEQAQGKLKNPDSFVSVLLEDEFAELPVTAVHASQSLQLPAVHSDPFDRMLAAQILAERLVLATRDRRIQPCDVPTVAA